MKQLVAASILGALLSAAPNARAAAPIVYSGSQQISDIRAVYSITTDGTLGVIDKSNVTSYLLELTRNGTTTTLTIENSGIRGSFAATADVLSATQTNQYFQINSNAVPTAPGTPVAVGYSNLIDFSRNQIQVQLVDGTNKFAYPDLSAGFASSRVVTPAVPEPATWATMLVGFGMIGAASRYRRRDAKVTYA